MNSIKRVRFGIKALLGLVSLVCAFLGGWVARGVHEAGPIPPYLPSLEAEHAIVSTLLRAEDQVAEAMLATSKLDSVNDADSVDQPIRDAAADSAHRIIESAVDGRKAAIALLQTVHQENTRP